MPVEDGTLFDLGGRLVEVIATPGHTPGSICLFDHKERLLLAGDTLSAKTVWLHIKDALPLETYLESLQRIAARCGRIDGILMGHGTERIGAEVIQRYCTCCEKILSEEVAGVIVETMVGDGLLYVVDGNGIVYKPRPAGLQARHS